MSEKMVRTQVYLPRDIYEQLKERGEREGLTLAHQIREALVEYVADVDEEEELPIISEDDPIWNIIGMVEGGPVDGSVNHDKYIYTRDWDLEPES
ncbi:MAG: CopG family transcriptional regulator [Chloroflexota bacterium]